MGVLTDRETGRLEDAAVPSKREEVLGSGGWSRRCGDHEHGPVERVNNATGAGAAIVRAGTWAGCWSPDPGAPHLPRANPRLPRLGDGQLLVLLVLR